MTTSRNQFGGRPRRFTCGNGTEGEGFVADLFLRVPAVPPADVKHQQDTPRHPLVRCRSDQVRCITPLLPACWHGMAFDRFLGALLAGNC